MGGRGHNIGEVQQTGSVGFHNDALVRAGMTARDGGANVVGQPRITVDKINIRKRLQALRGVPVGCGQAFVRRPGGQLPLGPLQHHPSVGKSRRDRAVVRLINHAAQMIEMQMAQHNVGHVFRCVTEGAQLAGQTAAAAGGKKLLLARTQPIPDAGVNDDEFTPRHNQRTGQAHGNTSALVGLLLALPDFTRDNTELRAAVIPPQPVVQKVNGDIPGFQHGADYNRAQKGRQTPFQRFHLCGFSGTLTHKGGHMPSVHDRGGWPDAGPINKAEHELSFWEKRTDALLVLLSSADRRVIRVDELRRAIESLPPEAYETMSYYERWISAIETLLIEKNVLTKAEIDRKAEQIVERRKIA